jgi:outer membrane lipoprotein-sorting protein
MKLLEDNTDAFDTVKGTVQISVSMEEPGYSGRVQAGLVAEKPDKARLKIYAGFANLIDLVVIGDSLWAFLPPRSVLVKGSVYDTDVPLEVGTFIVALKEALFPGTFCSRDCSAERSEGGTCRIEEDFVGGRRICFVETKSGRLRGIHLIDAEGEEWAEVRYRNYRRSGKIRFPRDIEISFPQAKLRMKFLFDRVKLNSPIEKDTFKLDVPPGTAVRGFEESQDMEGEEIGRDQGLLDLAN